MPRRGRTVRADVLLRDNIRDLLDKRQLTATALAAFCDHEPAWISKILSGERNAVIEDLDRIAAFFGLQISDLFRAGVSFETERRSGVDRRKQERRSGQERRKGSLGSAVRLGPQDTPSTALDRLERPRKRRRGLALVLATEPPQEPVER